MACSVYSKGFCHVGSLVLATLGSHAQTDTFEFVQLDDPNMVTGNPYVQRGSTGESIRWAFGEFYMGFWIPPTWLSLMLDVTLFGQDAAGHQWLMRCCIRSMGRCCFWRCAR